MSWKGWAEDGLVAVFDVGKTNAKLTAFAGESLTPAETLSIPNAPLRAGDYDQADTETLWHFLTEGLPTLARHGRITDIVPVTHGATAALVTETGLAAPIMDYEWPGLEYATPDYDDQRPSFTETGSPRLPVGLNLGRQLHYLEMRRPDAFSAAKAILPYPQYWAWRLGGGWASDVCSLGCHTDLWAPREGRFSSLASRRGWDRLVAPVREGRDSLGRLAPGLVAGVVDPVELRTGLHDSNAALYPFLAALDPPFTFVSSGTWAVVFAVGSAVRDLDAARDTLFNVDARGRPAPSGRFMAGREFEVIVTGAASAEPSLADALAVCEAGAWPRPGFAPGVGPFPDREGTGLDHPALDDPAARRAAASLYMAAMLVATCDLIGAEGPILIDGALGDDPLVPTILAALTGRHVSRTAANTSRGAAALVRAAPAPSEAVAAPEASACAALREAHATWRAAVSAA